ncbi:hypothetical protein [Nitrospirillum amazonense]|uniref:Uncharacterized protein n=1 Tax=Nitrospirillum amazonense TaxID=28077 RepID=A0A560JWN8_9PROT|nr:hypothetical protein [Nitrospirillum amazonense]MDG3440537.1 hypothetical protein [Nitrospirillum amazonense]TWB75129.1 hypothetical protein FBZ87_104228 [Nitrospirillum amazonense]
MDLGTDLVNSLIIHLGVTALLLWPAHRLVVRAGLPRRWPLWLALPLLGPVIFLVLLARTPWPVLPARQPKMHPRERLKRERAAAQAAASE